MRIWRTRDPLRLRSGQASLRLKNGSARDDAPAGPSHRFQTKPLPTHLFEGVISKSRVFTAGRGILRAAKCGFGAREIPFGSAQGRLSLRLKNGSAQDDAPAGPSHRFQTKPLPTRLFEGVISKSRVFTAGRGILRAAKCGFGAREIPFGSAQGGILRSA